VLCVLADILYLVTLAKIDGSSNAFVTSCHTMLPTKNIELPGRARDDLMTLRSRRHRVLFLPHHIVTMVSMDISVGSHD
jgi:hypothetical protein